MTINWNAPIAYLAAAMEVYFGKEDIVSSVSNNQKATIDVFPTVSSEGFYVDTDQELNYRILDMHGREIDNSKITKGQLIGTELTKGMYLIQLIDGQTSEVVRVIKK